MCRTAVLFPGQGAQTAGMSLDAAAAFPAAARVFEEASDVLGYDMQALVRTGDGLDATEYTQPAILTASIALWRVLEEAGVRADVLAGLSLGEYSALVAAGSLAFDAALPLVRKRGLFMQEAVPQGVGGMVAVIGLERAALAEILSEVGPDLWMANFNCPGQIVISGRSELLEEAVSRAEKAGAKMCVRLALSAPFHTPMLQPAAERLAEELKQVELVLPRVPVVFNVTAETERDPDAIRDLLMRQVMRPVLFEDSLVRMQELGAERFLELGPGSTLKGFVKRSLKKTKIVSVHSADTLEKAIESWKQE